MASQTPPNNTSIYEHGIATYALGEMYALARMGKKELPGMKEAFEGGVGFIIANQLSGGGWGYYKGTYESNATENLDLSVSGWQYQALKAAKLTALPIPGLHQSIDKAVKYLKSKQNHTKSTAYPAGGFGNVQSAAGYNQWALTGVGILGLQTLDKGGSFPSILAGFQFADSIFKEAPPDWANNCNLYAWYYYTQAYFQKGGKDWKKWNDTAMTIVLDNQTPDGSWKTEGTSPWHSIGTTAAGPDAGIYRTCVCTLMLEVYYRYLKVGEK